MTQELIERLKALDWKAPVPDDIQSEVRMQFNEALAGGPNMNGDAGPTLTPNHALDCVLATERIQSQSARIAELREVVEKCREKFDFYEQLHRLKCTAEGDEKADRNREMAAMCEASLTKDSTSG